MSAWLSISRRSLYRRLRTAGNFGPAATAPLSRSSAAGPKWRGSEPKPFPQVMCVRVCVAVLPGHTCALCVCCRAVFLGSCPAAGLLCDVLYRAVFCVLSTDCVPHAALPRAVHAFLTALLWCGCQPHIATQTIRGCDVRLDLLRSPAAAAAAGCQLWSGALNLGSEGEVGDRGSGVPVEGCSELYRQSGVGKGTKEESQ